MRSCERNLFFCPSIFMPLSKTRCAQVPVERMHMYALNKLSCCLTCIKHKQVAYMYKIKA